MAAATGDDPPVADGLILAAPAIWGWQTMSPLQREAVTDLPRILMPWMTVVPTGVHVQASSNRAALARPGARSAGDQGDPDRHRLWPGQPDEHGLRCRGEAGAPALAGAVRRARGDPEPRRGQSRRCRISADLPPEQGRLAIYPPRLSSATARFRPIRGVRRHGRLDPRSSGPAAERRRQERREKTSTSIN